MKLQRDPDGRTCTYCQEDLGETIPLDSNGICHGCGANFGKETTDEGNNERPVYRRAV
jgi:hypothetical protein